MSFLVKWLIFSVLMLLVSSTRITFKDYGYSDILIAVENAEDYDPQLIIDNLKEMITKASPILYKATKNFSYFKEIRILIPATWTNIPATESTWETYDVADVKVSRPNSTAQYILHVNQPVECGEPREYLFLATKYTAFMYTEKFIKKYGLPEKVFVYQWAHLRYGVFDEYGRDNTPQPIRSTSCVNQQANRVWTVIEEHNDFKDLDPNPNSVSNLQPIFYIVRPKILPARYVLVIDVSESMDQYNRMERAREAATRWIKSDIPNGSQVGIVEFSYSANIVVNLTEIVNEDSRNNLIEELPSTSGSSTCIGCGLTMAEEMLKETGNGGTILLITDGLQAPGLKSVEDSLYYLRENNIRVVTLTFGGHADSDIERLADLTGGISYFIPDGHTNTVTLQGVVNPSNFIIKLYERKIEFTSTIFTGDFIADNFQTEELKFQIYPLQKEEVKAIFLTSPSNEIYGDAKYSSNTAVIVVKSEPGVWEYAILLDKKVNTTFNVNITGQPTSNTTVAIRTICRIANGAIIESPAMNSIKILAHVIIRNNPVVGAKVIAYIEKPNFEKDIIELYDNGANADITANDGIYTSFYTKADVAGKYGVKCQVSNNDLFLLWIYWIGFICQRLCFYYEVKYSNSTEELRNFKSDNSLSRYLFGSVFVRLYAFKRYNGSCFICHYIR